MITDLIDQISSLIDPKISEETSIVKTAPDARRALNAKKSAVWISTPESIQVKTFGVYEVECILAIASPKADIFEAFDEAMRIARSLEADLSISAYEPEIFDLDGGAPAPGIKTHFTVTIGKSHDYLP